jgi:ribonuclease E
MRLFNILAITAAAAATAALIPQKASADRVCRQECSGPVCQERCVETEGRGDQREGREGREGLEERRGQRHEEREEGRGRGPRIELRVPGGGVEIGR